MGGQKDAAYSQQSNGAWEAAGQIGSAGVAAIGQQVGSKKQFKRSKQLMELQVQNQERLADSAYERQLQMWDETNFDAQVKQMKEAGLNPALIYGKGGGGGTTTGSNSQGSASGGHAPSNPMDIAQMVSAGKMMAELAMMKAATRKTNEEAESLRLDNKVKDEAGYEADLYEAQNRRDTELHKGQYLFENAKPDTKYEKGLEAEIEKVQLERDIALLEKKGKISDNEVRAYKGKLAKAGIDPDSNPVIREIMKAMAAAGTPLNKLLENAVRWFIK